MDRIIEIGKDSIFSLVQIKSKDLLSPETIKSEIEKEPHRYISTLSRLNKYYLLQDFVEHRNWFLFSCRKGGYLMTFYFNKQIFEANLIQKSWNDLLYKERSRNFSTPLPKLGGFDKNGVYYCYDTEFVSTAQKLASGGVYNANLDRLDDLEKIKEDANPIIFL